MILYNVTVSVDNTVHEEWLQWMQKTHIPEVMATGLFARYQICKLMDEIANGGTTYAIQYFANSLEDLQIYQLQFAPALQAESARRYSDKALAFRTVMEIIDPE